jgi:hypothetical protein
MRLRKHVLLLAFATAAIVGVPRALAEAPQQVPVEPLPPTTIAGACDFPILLEELKNKETLRLFTDGRQIITGRLVVRVTNLESGRGLVINVSGPGQFRLNRDGTASFILGGRGLLSGNAEMLDPLDPQVTLQSGRIVLTSDAETGEFIGAEFIGHSTDVCRELA